MKLAQEPVIPAHLDPGVLDDVLVHGADIDERDLRGDAIGVQADEVVLASSRISAARLTAGRFEQLRMTDVELAGCDLSGALFVEPVMRRVRFRDCRLSGTALELAELTDVEFVDCQMDTVGFTMARGERVRIERCSMAEASLRDATLEHAAIVGSDLTGVDVGNLRTVAVSLHGSTLLALKNVDSLRNVDIDASQMVSLGAQLLAAAKIQISEDPPPNR